MPQKYGALANAEPVAKVGCVVCDEQSPSYSWTDYSGEGSCTRCGTPYQLKWGTLKDGETYPRINVDAEWIPILRRYWAETHELNGAGSYMGFGDYPEQLRGRRRFNAWCDEHKAELPKEPEPAV
jgi:hypothetical protein